LNYYYYFILSYYPTLTLTPIASLTPIVSFTPIVSPIISIMTNDVFNVENDIDLTFDW